MVGRLLLLRLLHFEIVFGECADAFRLVAVAFNALVAFIAICFVAIAMDACGIHLAESFVAFVAAEAVTLLRVAERDMDEMETVFVDIRVFAAPAAGDFDLVVHDAATLAEFVFAPLVFNP